MNDNVVDFMRFMEKRKIEDGARDIVANACLLALIDITQDINAVGYLIAATGESGKEIAGRMVKRMNKESIYVFKRLLKQHAGNLEAFCKFLESSGEREDDSGITAETISEIVNEYLTSGATRVRIRMDEVLSHMPHGEYDGVME